MPTTASIREPNAGKPPDTAPATANRSGMPVTSCLINSYNYARYLPEAIDSAMAQTVPFDEIIVVDDGSTDGSAELVADRYGSDPRLQLIRKANGGQLSCFNAGFEGSRGDVLFFLDADDIFEPHYVEQSLDRYARYPESDVVFCGYQTFGTHAERRVRYRQDRVLGCGVAYALEYGRAVGNPTSCLSFRRRLLERILPLPLEEDWFIRADDCLLLGAALAGGCKLFLAEALVKYRVHEANNLCGSRPDPLARYRHEVACRRVIDHYAARFDLSRGPMLSMAHHEFATCRHPDMRLLRHYSKLAWRAPVPILRRCRMIGQMLRHCMACRPAGQT